MAKTLKFLLGDTPEEAQQAYEKYVKFLNKIATAYASSTGLDKGDLFGEAVLALSKAKATYNPDRGLFTKWMSFNITDALNNYVANNSSLVRVPEYILLSNKLVNKLRVTMELCTDDNNLVNSVIYTGDLSEAKFPAWAEEIICTTILKLHKAAKRAGVSYTELVKRANYLPEISEITSNLQNKELEEEKRLFFRIHIKYLKQHMTTKEKEIANLIMAGKTNKQIAQKFGKTPSWVTAQLKNMRKRFKDKGDIF